MKSRIVLHSFDSQSFDLIISGTCDEDHPGSGGKGPAFANAGVVLPPSPSPAVPTWIVSHGTLQLPCSPHTTSARIKAG
jgi:hypothetical protein